MENLLQNLFNESLRLLQNNEFAQSKKILVSVLDKVDHRDLRNNTFLLFNLGICDINLGNLQEALMTFMTIYDFYQTDRSLTIGYIPHLETIFNDSNNYDKGVFKLYSNRFDNNDLVYGLLNSFYISDYVPNKKFIDKINSKIKHPAMKHYFSHIYKIVFNDPDFDLQKLVSTINYNFDKVIELADEKSTYSIYDFSIFIYTNYYYYLCYLDTNIVNLQRKYSKILRKLMPEINYVSPNVQKRLESGVPQKKKKIKLGFLSFMMADLSSVLRDRANIIKGLTKDQFEIHLISYGPPKDMYLEISLIKSLYDMIPHKHYLTQLTSTDRSIDRKITKYLSDLDLDVLVFSDIGMAIESVIFAHMRLAPIQINTWGHSVTSGISTIDYYFSSDLYESETAQDNYSEKLIKMKSMCTCYPQIILDIKYEDRKELKIPTNKFILSCMQMRHKFKPEFLRMLNRILKAFPQCIVIMMDTNNIKEYFSLFIENLDQVMFIPKCTFNVFNKYIYFSDLILDTFPFGGCNSSLEGFNFNKVVVTKPSPYLSGRFTYGFYKRMNIFDAVAYDNEEYFEIVSELITNNSFRLSIQKQINEKKKRLFEDQDSIKEWSTTIKELAKPYVELVD